MAIWSETAIEKLSSKSGDEGKASLKGSGLRLRFIMTSLLDN